MQVNLAGQVAWVTGGAHGIGRAIVNDLVASGAAVAILDLDLEGANATAAELTAAGHKVRAWQADVTDGARIRELEEIVSKELGPASILVNNAGINTARDRRPIHEYAEEDWHRILAVDLTGVFQVSRAVIPRMLAGGGGRIVNISSIAGLVPLRLQTAYNAAKGGVINLSRSMAAELGPQNVLTNCVVPGSILTRGTRALFYDASGAYSTKAASLLAHIPQGRPGTPEEIAHAVLFLVSPEASYINGAVLTVDGGWTAGYTRDW